MSRIRHFLTLNDLSREELLALLKRASELKVLQRNGTAHGALTGKVMAMIFAKSSTRTRVSFEAGMTQLGGSAMFLSPNDTQMGRGEPISDTAKVISSMVDIVMIRTFAHADVELFATHSSVPVINALTDDYHPCQLLADMQTWIEHRGDVQGKTVCWLGDGNNMCQSYINAAKILGFHLKIACPEGFEPSAELMDKAQGYATIEHDPRRASEGAHLLVTDVWASMGQEDEARMREQALSNYQLNQELLDVADTEALYFHCLPAHRGEEITADLMDNPKSVIWDEAENRLHAQKALIEFLLS
ncbi:MAG: ornithine carbamoyltransferase [Luminiphilus sp.]|jgi:ornithine carbamoyltransferase|nr:ornithine carbamoyltransferase [Halieaceae bacterium]MCH1459205.1 ornithine carbamoyltransferase [Luminiphilus sp.]OUV04449.1 MAG: ornithine carbamoyltransferase [Cellvibrionales bacterium TMED79]|tara:strand:- start:28 stop:933 length:906 start_codon:yes stop_codon:yes gene_type:complete